MKKRNEELFAALSPHYSPTQAEQAVNALLRPLGAGCKIEFQSYFAEIFDAYLVSSRTLRLQICEIIRRTGKTARTSENLAAEWVLHNLSYAVRFFPNASKDVSLDYKKDPRFPVALISYVFEKLHIY